MNNERRKRIASALEQIEEVKSEIEQLAEEERGAYENMPESLQESERGNAMEEAADNLDNAASSLEEAIDYLNSIE